LTDSFYGESYGELPSKQNHLKFTNTIANFIPFDDFINKNSGLIGKDLGHFDYSGWEYIVLNPNQIKHIENLGTFNPNDPNMYHMSAEPNSQEYKQQSVILEEFFGDMLNTLFNGGSVSTQRLIQHLLDTGSFAEFNVVLAEALKNHDIQIVF